MITYVIHFMYLFRIYMILIVYQQNLQQITLTVHEKIKNKLKTFEPKITEEKKKTRPYTRLPLSRAVGQGQ